MDRDNVIRVKRHLVEALMLVSDGESVVIPVVKHEQLLLAKRQLDALEDAGVHNWEGYTRALDGVQDAN